MLVVGVRMSIMVMVEIMIQFRLSWMVRCVLSVWVMVMVTVVTQVIVLGSQIKQVVISIIHLSQI